MITVNAYPALVIVLSDLHSLSTILQTTQQGGQDPSQRSSKSSNEACSGALRPTNGNRSRGFQGSEAVNTPFPSTGPWKALGLQNTRTLPVPEPALCTCTATVQGPLSEHWASQKGYLTHPATKSLIRSRCSRWAPPRNTNTCALSTRSPPHTVLPEF